ncbi:hypothetical protein SK224_08165 [Microbacterium sp. BG28]|uniref:hypothetical protein n=1 Tax=Microbacterium sp. BG28 TaxID=3097356 RepID=UPI002A5B1079|nr:hypothetical protein [Microbacterium sp. BG28]MDY0829102.1 hypothetical protein [Microbacterium sp. BG28]
MSGHRSLRTYIPTNEEVKESYQQAEDGIDFRSAFYERAADSRRPSPPTEDPARIQIAGGGRASGKTQRMVEMIIALANNRGLQVEIIEPAPPTDERPQEVTDEHTNHTNGRSER